MKDFSQLQELVEKMATARREARDNAPRHSNDHLEAGMFLAMLHVVDQFFNPPPPATAEIDPLPEKPVELPALTPDPVSVGTELPPVLEPPPSDPFPVPEPSQIPPLVVTDETPEPDGTHEPDPFDQEFTDATEHEPQSGSRISE